MMRIKDKITWTWKRIVGTVLGILGIGTLTSCYGVPEDMYDILGEVKGTVNGTEQAIPNIAVAAYDSDAKMAEAKTDANGKFALAELEAGTYRFTFTDIDGEENGSFAQKEVAVSLSDSIKDLAVSLDAAQ